MYRIITPSDFDEKEVLHPVADSSKVSSQRVVSKSAHAKKLLNKKIKINQHIKFDEEGEPVEQDISGGKIEDSVEEERSGSSDSDGELSVRPVSIDEFERSEKCLKVGGIKIEKAKERLRLRDKMDRKRERERIRAAHRERKLKSHQRVREEEAGEGGEREGVRLAVATSSEDEQGRDASDLQYENETPSQRLLAKEGEESTSSDEEIPTPKRQKLDKRRKLKKKERKHKQLGAEPKQSSLVDDEELALHLLMT